MKALKALGEYKKYNLFVQSIIDRAYYSAISSVPNTRVDYIENAIKQVISMEPSTEVIDIITSSTAGKTKEEENAKEKVLNPNDDSGELFLQVFVASIFKLTNMLYKVLDSDDIVSQGRTVYSICKALNETDNAIIIEYSNYDAFGEEIPNMSSDGWVSCALISISPAKNLRIVNAYTDLSDLEFVIKLKNLLG